MMVRPPRFIVGRYCVLEYSGYVRPEKYCTLLYQSRFYLHEKLFSSKHSANDSTVSAMISKTTDTNA